MIFLLSFLEFFCGALMFSYWLGLAAKKDLKTVGDGNPGAFNLWHAAGFKLGILGVFLDFFKGYFPLVLLIESKYINNWWIVPVAVAPILGHAFSPFLKFKGGKAIAVTFGIWSAVTRFEVSLAYAIILAGLEISKKFYAHKLKKELPRELDGLMVVLGMAILSVYLIIRNFQEHIILLLALNLIILIYKNREKLYTLFMLKFGSSKSNIPGNQI